MDAVFHSSYVIFYVVFHAPPPAIFPGAWKDRCLSRVVEKVRSLGDVSLEVDTSKDQTITEEQLSMNQEQLKNLLDIVITDIFNELNSCPLALKHIYSKLQVNFDWLFSLAFNCLFHFPVFQPPLCYLLHASNMLSYSKLIDFRLYSSNLQCLPVLLTVDEFELYPFEIN